MIIYLFPEKNKFFIRAEGVIPRCFASGGLLKVFAAVCSVVYEAVSVIFLMVIQPC